MRVFIPGTPDTLALEGRGAVEASLGFAASPEMVTALGDEEVAAEYARDAAALASVMDLRSPRRMVIVVDLAPTAVEATPSVHPAAVRLVGPVGSREVACVFIDEEGVEADALAAATGDAAALERLEERDLLWYDASEIEALVAAAGHDRSG